MKCTIKGLDINYLDIGSGKPILFIHGFYVDHRLMTGCMEPIFEHTDGYRRIYIDLPGMGESQCTQLTPSTEAILNIVLEFIEVVLKNENFILAGQSYGGYLSRALVKIMPERIDGLLLICPVIFAESSYRDLPKHMVLYQENILPDNPTESDEDFEDFVVVQSKYVYNRYMNEILPGNDCASSDFLDELFTKAYALPFDVDDITSPYTKPALILTGKQDSVVGYNDQWSILKNYPRATLAVLDMAGHNLQIEQP